MPKKPFDELTEAELLELKDEEIQAEVDLRCAQRGVRLLPLCPEKPAEVDVEFDQNLYCIAGLYFLNEDAALNIKRCIDAESQYEVTTEYITGSYSWSLPKTWKRATGDHTVTSMQVLSPNVAADKKQALVKYEALKKEFEDADNDYKAVKAERDEIEEAVWAPVHKAQENQRARARFAAEFARYLVLSNNLHDVAYKFLIDAYPDAKKAFPTVGDLIKFLKDQEATVEQG